MNKVKLQEIAKSIKDLEIQCQNGIDIEKNERKMEELMLSLNFEELLILAAYMEDIDLQN